jgi:magnesium chelatase family protein
MLATVSSATLVGVDGHPVSVEVHVSNGLPGFRVVGLPDASCREARDRVRAALISSGFAWPQKRITVNLAPSGLRKAGSGLDLAVALGVLAADGQIAAGPLAGAAFIAELGLDGSLRRVPGILPLVAAAGQPDVVVPPSCGREASLVRRARTRTAGTLRALVQALRGQAAWPEMAPDDECPDAPAAPDLVEVRGQPFGRQALEVAAAGGHHLLMVGPAGAGKTMLATRLPGLLPPLSADQALEVAMIHSAAGLDVASGGLCLRPPFRSPHHSASAVSLIGGGGARLRPGEISCAHAELITLGRQGTNSRFRTPRRVVPRRAGRVPRGRARQLATAPRRGPGGRLPGQRRSGFPGPVHAGGGHERLPLRR